MVKELLFEGNNRFFDKTVCLGLQASDADIEKLCRQMLTLYLPVQIFCIVLSNVLCLKIIGVLFL